MSRDYARKPRPASGKSAAPAKRKSSPAPGRKPAARQPAPARSQHGGLSLRWLLALAAVGGFIGFIVYLNSLPPVESTDEQATGKQEQSLPEPKKEEKKKGFTFYEMLPDSEVVAPKVEEYTPGPIEQDFAYLVQTGSFRSQEDAERQRAQIAFQGLRAKIQQVDMDNGSTWYRVNVGPYTSRSQMNSALDKLVNINIQPLVRKIPKEG